MNVQRINFTYMLLLIGYRSKQARFS
ncbi:uncharacterized protein METZ01_LOCUS312913 [marine metagenome]|uniref:Uncharacterized protein n=1 Tax=marine metagenome TaxID=408172 RepID=A0A382NFT5_9ZZZZ